MTPEQLKLKYAAMPPLFSQSDYLNIEENKPVTFFVLCEQYTSKGTVWFLPVGVHFVSKRQIVCAEVAEADPCFVCEKIREMEKQGVPESEIFRVRGPRKYAMNVLVRGEQSPRVFLAPATVGTEIVATWEAALNEENVNIFDSMASTAWTVTRTKEGRNTHYNTDFAVELVPIITGDNVEARITTILKSAANLDSRFRLPTREEQEAAWRNR